MKINKRGFWEEVCNHHTDQGLLNTFINMVKYLDSIVDFGCGDASYVKAINSTYPDKTVLAFDGNPNVKDITQGFANCLDLSRDFDLKNTFDLVMSLEVAEHIPVQYETTFIQNLIKHTNQYLLLSWAIPGQGGKGHVNEKPNDYVTSLFNELGFMYLDSKSDSLRNSVTNCPWFKNTLFLFQKI